MFKKRVDYFKIIIFAFLVISLFLIQVLPGNFLRISGQKPSLLLILSICIAFYENEAFSAFFGAVCGFLCDVVTSSSVGLSAIYFMFASFIISIIINLVFRRVFLTYIIIALITISVYHIGAFVLYNLVSNDVPFWLCVKNIILPKICVDGIFSFIMYWIVKKIIHKVSDDEEEI